MGINGLGRTYCDADVHDGGWSVGFRKCGKTARFEYKGKDYCKTHYPPAADARKADAPKCQYKYEDGGHCPTIVRGGAKICALHQRIRRFEIPRNRIKELEAALKPFAKFGAYLIKHPRSGLADNLYSWDNKVFLRHRDLCKAAEVLRRG